MSKKSRLSFGSGFTLIELLIVIAIILILIAIALPNFLEAQERARVTRANGHLRTMETGIFAHITDYGYLYADYNDGFGVRTWTRNHVRMWTSPCPVNASIILSNGGIHFGLGPRSDRGFQQTFYSPGLHCPLTTPIKYLDEDVTVDPWSDGSIPVGMDSRELDSDPLFKKRALSELERIVYAAYFVSGPDRQSGHWQRGCCGVIGSRGSGIGLAYNPTNGTRSPGDLWFVVANDIRWAQFEYEPLKTF